MNVLIVGASCLLGKYLERTCPEGVALAKTWYTNPAGGLQADVGDPSQVGYVFAKARPDRVIHMAAPGDVDWCERNYTLAERVIVGGTKAVLREARDCGAKVLYVSTNAVFSGDDPPYSEGSERRPVNRYGALRRRAEDVVLNEHGSVVRLFLLYGWPPPGARTNWGAEIARRLSRGERVRLVDDRWWQPTWAGHAAQAVWRLMEESGVWHFAGADRTTLHGFGQRIAGAFGLDASLLEPIGSEDLPGIAPRPLDTTFCLDKARVIMPVPGLDEGLKEIRDEDLRTD